MTYRRLPVGELKSTLPKQTEETKGTTANDLNSFRKRVSGVYRIFIMAIALTVPPSTLKVSKHRQSTDFQHPARPSKFINCHKHSVCEHPDRPTYKLTPQFCLSSDLNPILPRTTPRSHTVPIRVSRHL